MSTFIVDTDYKNLSTRVSESFPSLAEAIAHAARMAMDSRVAWSGVRNLGMDVKVGDKVHLGFGTKGGAGFKGTVTKVEGEMVEIKNPEGKTYRGPLSRISEDAGLRKSTIAKEAVRQMQSFYDILQDSNWSGSAAKFHANSASNYLKAIKEGGEQIPAWVEKNAGFLKAQGWRW